MVQAQRMNRRHRVDAAIAYALERRWDLAAAENRALLDEDKADVESANRLGKALTELGDIPGAIEAYEHALAVDATNAIARKNLARLEEQRKLKRPARAGAKPKATKAAVAARPTRRVDVATESLRTSPLIEDFGKSADLVLVRVNARAAEQVSTGDPAELEITGSGIAVKTAGGAILGHVNPRTGLRLKRMIEGGNRYSVVVLRASDDQIEVHVRETQKHPSLVGQASFLPQVGDARRRRTAPRAYTKSSVVQYEADEDEDFDTEDEEDDVWRPRVNRDLEEDEDVVDEDEDEEEEEDFSNDLPEDDEDTPFAVVEDDADASADEDEDEDEAD